MIFSICSLYIWNFDCLHIGMIRHNINGYIAGHFLHVFFLYVFHWVAHCAPPFSCKYWVQAHRTDKWTCILLYLSDFSLLDYCFLFFHFFCFAKALSIYSSLVCTFNEFHPRILSPRLDFYLCTCWSKKKKSPLLRVFITGPLYESKENGGENKKAKINNANGMRGTGLCSCLLGCKRGDWETRVLRLPHISNSLKKRVEEQGGLGRMGVCSGWLFSRSLSLRLIRFSPDSYSRSKTKCFMFIFRRPA